MSGDSRRRARLERLVVCLMILFAAILVGGGCGNGEPKKVEVEDPQLKPIQAMLDQNLPIGTPDSAVNHFLAMRGYDTVPTDKPGTIVAIIPHIDTEKLQQVTARVTFYFDANGKLNTYEIVRTMNPRIPQ